MVECRQIGSMWYVSLNGTFVAYGRSVLQCLENAHEVHEQGFPPDVCEEIIRKLRECVS